MKKLFVLLTVLMLALGVAAQVSQAAPTAKNCPSITQSGGFTPLGSLNIPFSCTAEDTVYFGACDSGSVPNDDLFQISYNGTVVSQNWYQNGKEFASVNSAVVPAGTHMAVLESLNVGVGLATYTYAVSSDKDFVVSTLEDPNFCGGDTGGVASGNACWKSVPLFTTDTAPSNGTLRMTVQYGAMNRLEGQTMRVWDVEAGEQINNEPGLVPSPKWVRVWWQPDGSSDSYLLTSQYWQGDGTLKSEYGVSCNASTPPSYHTSFSSAIHEDDVPELSGVN